MGGILRVRHAVPLADLRGEGLVHRHVRAGDIPPEQLNWVSIAAGMLRVWWGGASCGGVSLSFSFSLTHAGACGAPQLFGRLFGWIPSRRVGLPTTSIFSKSGYQTCLGRKSSGARAMALHYRWILLESIDPVGEHPMVGCDGSSPFSSSLS